MSAYACEPNRGSEPGVGWNWVRQMSRSHEVWVLTRRNNRPVIEAAPAESPLPNAHFVYYDLPRWARFWKRGHRGVYLYYYLWQIGAYWEARRLHAEIGFDLAHHVTFVMYWMPSFLALLPVPFVWGPVGGGESTPPGFRSALGGKGRLTEILRTMVQALARLDPLIRLTSRRSTVAFATTVETEKRLTQIGCRNTQVCSVMGLDADEINELSAVGRTEPDTFRIATVGNLIAWKGVEFGLRAFAVLHPKYPRAEYWLVGDGPEKPRLRLLAQELGIAFRVRFLGRLTRPLALAKLASCDVLLLPSLHDSGSCVCTEAMALGKPVVCLDAGGPALQVTATTGFKIPAESPEQAVRGLAKALEILARDPELARRMGEDGRARVRETLNWDIKGLEFSEVYRRAAGSGETAPVNLPATLGACRE